MDSGVDFTFTAWSCAMEPRLVHYSMSVYSLRLVLSADISQNVATKLLWGRQVEAIPQEALRAVTATTALCHFASTIVMIGSLTIGLIACR